MKIINKILNIILITYFTSLVFLLTACFCLPARISILFQIFFAMTEVFRVIIAIILVILISKFNEMLSIKKEIQNYKEVD